MIDGGIRFVHFLNIVTRFLHKVVSRVCLSLGWQSKRHLFFTIVISIFLVLSDLSSLCIFHLTNIFLLYLFQAF